MFRTALVFAAALALGCTSKKKDECASLQTIVEDVRPKVVTAGSAKKLAGAVPLASVTAAKSKLGASYATAEVESSRVELRGALDEYEEASSKLAESGRKIEAIDVPALAKGVQDANVAMNKASDALEASCKAGKAECKTVAGKLRELAGASASPNKVARDLRALTIADPEVKSQRDAIASALEKQEATLEALEKAQANLKAIDTDKESAALAAATAKLDTAAKKLDATCR